MKLNESEEPTKRR